MSRAHASAYESEGGFLLHRFEVDEPADLAGTDEAARVLDLVAPGEDGLAAWLEAMDVDVEDVLRRIRTFRRPRVRPLGESLLVVWPMIDEKDDRVPVMALLRRGLLVLIREGPVPDLDGWLREACTWRRPGGSSVLGLLTSLFDHMLTLRVAEHIAVREETDRLMRGALSAPEDVEPGDVLHTMERRAAISGRTENLVFLLIMLRTEDAWLGQADTERRALAVIEEGLRHLQSALDRLDERLEDIHGQYQAAQQKVTIRRLNVLTMLSSIFLPLTLIAGIYGMNFKGMPELQVPWAYPATLAAMALIAGVMFLLFWRRGWLR